MSRLYNETLGEDVLEFGDLAETREYRKQELKWQNGATMHKRGESAEAKHIEARDEFRHMRRSIIEVSVGIVMLLSKCVVVAIVHLEGILRQCARFHIAW